MLGSLFARRIASNRARHSPECRVPAAGRCVRAREHFRQSAAQPCSSSMACVMFARLGAGAALARGGGAGASWATWGM
eukprot:7835450-Alexandrium_andersonii.AAC.1